MNELQDLKHVQMGNSYLSPLSLNLYDLWSIIFPLRIRGSFLVGAMHLHLILLISCELIVLR